MDAAERTAVRAIPAILAIGAAVAWAGSQGGVAVRGVPLFALCGALAFAVNWGVFVHAFLAQTERFFDLTGSITYLSLVALALGLHGDPDPRALLVGALVAVWALRLGSFLFSRITRDGSDGRFDELKPSFVRFLMTWTLQGLWVFLTLSCGLAAMTSEASVPWDGFATAGLLLWLFGLTIEVVADLQKSRFRADPANRDRFIQSGVWAWSRHPNYFGEICLWAGVAVLSFPVLSGWQHVTLISPVFVYVLLTRISGIPMLESRGKKKWGDDPDYQAHKRRTPLLFPRPPRAA